MFGPDEILTKKQLVDRYGAAVAMSLLSLPGLKVVKLGRMVAVRSEELLRAFRVKEHVLFFDADEDYGEAEAQRVVGGAGDSLRDAQKLVRKIQGRGDRVRRGRPRDSELRVVDGNA